MKSARNYPSAPSSAPSAPMAFTIEDMDVCAFAADLHGVITAWNAAAERRFGVPAQRARGARCCVLLRANGVACCSRCPHHHPDHPGATAPSDAASMVISGARVALLALPIHLPGRELMLAHILYPIAPALVAAHDAPDPAAQTADAELVAALAPCEDSPRHAPPRLTLRERETLRLLASGLATSDIAFAMTISVETARKYIAQTLAKLGASTRVEAALIARKLRLFDDRADREANAPQAEAD